METNQLVMSIVAFEEVEHKTSDCSEWLKENNIEILAVSGTILQDAMRIKEALGIVGDNYHAKGVDEKDILIIATARAKGAELVSDEAKQPGPLQISSKRKIPAVCAMPTVAVSCINFIEFIRASGTVFR